MPNLQIFPTFSSGRIIHLKKDYLALFFQYSSQKSKSVLYEYWNIYSNRIKSSNANIQKTIRDLKGWEIDVHPQWWYTKLHLLKITIFGWKVWNLNSMIQPIKKSVQSSKMFNQRIRKRYHKTLGTNIINSQMFPHSLENDSFQPNNDFFDWRIGQRW